MNNKQGGEKSVKTQVEKYGSKEGFSADMARRANMRKTIGKGGFYDPEVAKRAAAKSAEVRAKNAKRKKSEEDLKSEASHYPDSDKKNK